MNGIIAEIFALKKRRKPIKTIKDKKMKELQYYRLRASQEEKAKGIHAQIRGTVSGLKRPQVEYFQQLSNETFPDQLQHVQDLKLEPGARLTDVLSMNYLKEKTGLFVSGDMKKVLDDHMLHNAKFFDVTVVKGKEKYPYYFLYVLRAPDLIDYERSTFIEKAITGKAEPKPADVTSYEQWKKGPPQQRDDISAYQIQKAVLQKEVDLLRLPLSVYVYVSEALKKSIEEADLSGLEFHAPEKGVSFFK